MDEQSPPLDPHPLSDYVAWAGRRNRDPILEALKGRIADEAADVLEFGSGSGMHIVYFAPHFPQARFHPSDKTSETFAHIDDLRAGAGVMNVQAPTVLDLIDEATWPNPQERRFETVFCINIFQVAPLRVAEGMMACASSLLTSGGRLLIYGPFKVDGAYTTRSNEEFDQKLRSANVPEWGLKDVTSLTEAASSHGLTLKERVDMPVNNHLLVYGRG